MRAGRRSLLLQFAVAVLAVSFSAMVACAAAQDARSNKKALALLDTCPALFAEDSGNFVHRGKGANVLLSEDGVTFQLFDKAGSESATDVFRVTFPGSRVVRPEGLGKSGAQFNYYTGNDPAQWRTGLPTFEKVIYRGLYPGIDLVVHGLRSHLKYEFIVAPGGDYRAISVAYHDILGLSLDADGKLCVQTTLGELVEDAPYVYQTDNGVNRQVACQYRLSDDSRYTFSITGEYDRNAALIIDPDLTWSTFLGGADGDYGYGIATDGEGNVFVAGDTWSSDFPTPNGWDTEYNGDPYDAFVAKFDSNGELLWSTFLGGDGSDWGCVIATDGEGNAFVTGNTESSNFPTPDGWDTSYNGGGDAFVAKFNSNGMVLWSTFLGGAGEDWGNGNCEGIATDAVGNVFVTGGTDSLDFPTLNGWDIIHNGYDDAFVAKFDPDGVLLWSTFLGGAGYDRGNGIATDVGGNVFATGPTGSTDFPTSDGCWDTSFNGECDAFVAKFDPSGALLWSTFLGGIANDRGYGIATDVGGNVFVAGETQSFNFPTPDGWDTSHNGGDDEDYDAFVAKFDPLGELLWSTFLGGASSDWGTAIATDGDGSAFVIGNTESSDFPTPNGWDTSYNGGLYDAFVAKFRSDGKLLWSAFMGGGDYDYGYGIGYRMAGNGDRNVFVTGYTYSSDFPTLNGWNTSLEFCDAFVAKFTETMYWLDVQSTPVTGISITGAPAGTTGYSTSLLEITSVELTAPENVSPNYGFDRWTVNGVPKPAYETTVTFDINTDTTALASYQVIQETVFPVMPTLCPAVATECPESETTCPPVDTECPAAETTCPPVATECPVASVSLIVRSTPIAGVAIAGTPSGTTNYTSAVTICPVTQVSLTAPATVLQSGKSYWFVRWVINGVGQAIGNRAVALDIDANTTAVATYKYVRYLKITGPTRVIGGTTVKYACRAYYSAGSSSLVTYQARWYENSRYARFLSPARMKTYAVRSRVNCRITAKYGGVSGFCNIYIIPR